MREIKAKEHMLILRGDFNPVLFQPLWLAANKLIGETEAQAADVKLIHQSVAQFNLGWVQFRMTPDTLLASTVDESRWENLRDLFVGIANLIRYAPTTALGINVVSHFQVKDEVEWHEIGHKLVPKPIWEKVLRQPGMRSVLVEGQHSKEFPGATYIKIEPSLLYPHAIFIEVNDHHNLTDQTTGQPQSISVASGIIEKTWGASMDQARNILKTLIDEL